MDNTPAIGIDLGTTCSCVGVFQHGNVEIITNDHGERSTSSYVAFTDTERLIGDAAKNQASMNPKNTVFAAKRLIGRSPGDQFVEINTTHWPFEVANDEDQLKIKANYKDKLKLFYPEEISAMLLEKMKTIAEGYLGRTITSAVVTVPAYFNYSQREATKNAAAVAGLKSVRIINEPTAAAIAYVLDRKCTKRRNILIFDLGGGALEVSVIAVENNNFTVKGTAADTNLGGEDFDTRMMCYCALEFCRLYNKDLTSDKRVLMRLKIACEKAKRILSINKDTRIELRYLFEGIDFNCIISRDIFEEINASLFQRIFQPVQKALREAKLNQCSIDDVVLVGGSTRIPKIQQLLQQYFNGKELLNRDEAVASGAAIQAAILNGDKSKLIKGFSLHDILPVSIGIRTGSGIITVIKRNSNIPVTKTDSFTTAVNKQSAMSFPIYEVQCDSKCNLLSSEVRITGIPPAPRCTVKADITLSIDDNYTITVEVVEKSSCTRLNNVIRLVDNLERMKKGAEVYRKEDQEEKRISPKISLENFVYNTKSVINVEKLKENLSEEEEKGILYQLEETIKWIDNNQVAEKYEIINKHVKLTDVCNPIMNYIYILIHSDIPGGLLKDFLKGLTLYKDIKVSLHNNMAANAENVSHSNMAADAENVSHNNMAANAENVLHNNMAADAENVSHNNMAANAENVLHNNMAADAENVLHNNMAADAENVLHNNMAADAENVLHNNMAANAKKGFTL